MERAIIVEKLLELIAQPFIYFNIKPTHITFLSLFFGIMASILFYYSLFLLSLLFISLSFLLDAVDGYVARKTNKVTNIGAFIDGVFDRVVEFLFLLSIALCFSLFTLQIVLIMVFGTFMHSFLKCYAVYRKVLEEKKVEKFGEFEGLMPRRIRVFGIILLSLSLIFNYFPFEFSWLFATASVFSSLHLFIKIIKVN